MEILYRKNAAPVLEIGAIAGLTVHEIDESVKELEKEGLIRIVGGPQLYEQIAILKRSSDATWQQLYIPLAILFIIAMFLLAAMIKGQQK